MYQFYIGKNQYVAKKLVDVGDGYGIVDEDTALDVHSGDLVRLKTMEHFREQFVQEAKKLNVAIAGGS